ncbi:MAG: hypothetical protein JWL72_3323 [Ilumatobacteraceae bacterium]|nr:hypothetical protein [Ilumatobacteraceae bacterium]MCU1389985.1 hypothetical protein [Ilumatobacteraceae bacterium]
MTTQALLILHEKCNKPAVEPEWIAWHREVHEADLRTTGAEHVTFWQLSTKPAPGMPGVGFSHVTIAEYPTTEVPAFAPALAALRASGRVHEAHTVVDAATYVSHGEWNHKPVPSTELRGHILALVMPNDSALEAEWDEWYDRDHVPDMIASGAFSAATRWRRDPRRAIGADFATLYDVSLPSIDEAVAKSAAVMPGIVASGRKHPAHTGALTVTLTVPGG